MKKSIVTAIVVVTLAIVATVVVALRGRNHTFEQNFHIEAAAYPGRVTKIFMADKENNHVLLTYIDDSLWVVDSLHAASQKMVDLLLETMADMRIRRQVNNAAVDNIVTQLAVRSVKVEVYYKAHRIDWFGGKFRLFPYERCQTFYVGHDTQDMLAT